MTTEPDVMITPHPNALPGGEGTLGTALGLFATRSRLGEMQRGLKTLHHVPHRLLVTP